MTRNEQHVHDISTLANFKDWAMSIGAALAAFGWIKSAETGQVDWAAIASVPTAGNYVFEIWKPGDALTPFYVRFDYGNAGGAPSLKIQTGTTTNGAGTLTGITTTQMVLTGAANSGGTTFNCLFSGGAGWFAMMLWRDANAAFNVYFAIERSKNTAGVDVDTYYSYIASRVVAAPQTWQQAVVFGVGAAPVPNTGANSVPIALYARQTSATSLAFNGNVPVSPVFPCVGYYDNPMLTTAVCNSAELTEAAQITTTLYGAPHTYVFSKNQLFVLEVHAYLMRWE